MYLLVINYHFSAFECLYAPPVITQDLEIQIEPVNEFVPIFSPAIIIKDIAENTGPGMFELNILFNFNMR